MEGVPTKSQYCAVCLKKDYCDKDKSCSCTDFVTNVKYHKDRR